MLCPWRIYFYLMYRGKVRAGLSPNGSVKNNPAGIRSIVYGMGKGKGGIEGSSVFWHGLAPLRGRYPWENHAYVRKIKLYAIPQEIYSRIAPKACLNIRIV